MSEAGDILVNCFKKVMFRFRPHHLVCFLSFQGKGYDSDFVNGVNEILTALKSNPNEKLITVVYDCDSACEKCPNRNSGKCKDDEVITALDSAYTKLLKINEGNQWSFADMQLIPQHISKADFVKICGKCQWFEICLISLFNQ